MRWAPPFPSIILSIIIIILMKADGLDDDADEERGSDEESEVEDCGDGLIEQVEHARWCYCAHARAS